jgi:hypothetical protein
MSDRKTISHLCSTLNLILVNVCPKGKLPWKVCNNSISGGDCYGSSYCYPPGVEIVEEHKDHRDFECECGAVICACCYFLAQLFSVCPLCSRKINPPDYIAQCDDCASMGACETCAVCDNRLCANCKSIQELYDSHEQLICIWCQNI